MNRTLWFVVLAIASVFAVAGLMPWGSAPARPPVVAAPAPAVTPSGWRPANRGGPTTPPGASDDKELVAAAWRGGLAAAAACVLVLGAGAALARRGGARRRALALAGRGLDLVEVARRTRLPQDAVRTVLSPSLEPRSSER